jgi:hypothetical protein
MQMVVILLCLINNDKNKNLYMFNTDLEHMHFFPKIFDLQLVDSVGMETADLKGQLYIVFLLFPHASFAIINLSHGYNFVLSSVVLPENLKKVCCSRNP